MLVTLDFETYYDAKYSLRSKDLSTSLYVRDPRFEVINCSMIIGDGAPFVVWGYDAIKVHLGLVDWDEAELLAHHAHFEGLVLSHHFGVRPRVYRDTLSMGRLLFPKTERNDLETLAARLGVANKLKMPDFKGKHLADFDDKLRADVAEYVKGDVVSCYEAYEKMLPRVPSEEMELIDATVRMFADPVLHLDKPRCEAELEREKQAKAKAIAEAGVSEEVLGSSAKLAKALADLGVTPPVKPSPTNPKKSTWAFAKTDLEFTGMVRHPDPRVAALVTGRLAAKSTITETRAARLLRAWEQGLLPVYLNYCGAHTTRWSGGDKLNFQNFTRGGELRLSIKAPPGHRLVVSDSSQIEVRVLAWLAGERWLLDEFARGKAGDPYCAFATKAFQREITKADKDERQVAKPCVLLLGFGGGAEKLQHTLAIGTYGPPVDLPLDVCQGFVNTYRQTSRAIAGHGGLWDIMQDAIGDIAKGKEGSFKCLSWAGEELYLPNGTTLHYPGCQAHVVQARRPAMFGGGYYEKVLDGSYATPKGRSKLYGGLMTENVVQALARIIVASHMAVIARRHRVVMMSHDEVVTCVPEDVADEALAFQLETMRQRPAWAPDLMLEAEGGHDVCYSK